MGTTISTSFEAVGVGNALSVRYGDSFTYSVSGTFVGTVKLEKSNTAGNTWEAIASATAAASGTVKSEASDRGQTMYRFRCSAFTSGTIVTSLVDAAMVLQNIEDSDGSDIFQVTEDGVTLGKNLTVTGTITASAASSVLDANFSVKNDNDETKIAKFECGSITTATTRTYTLPDASTTLVGHDATQTLTNKTLTSPAINTPTVTTPTFATSTLTSIGVGAKNGATVSVVEHGGGVLHKSILTLASTPVTVENTSGASFGGVKLYDFPEGRILVLGCTASLGFVWTGEDIAADGSGDYSLGTTITSDATLDGTDVDLLPSTAMTDPFVSGVGAATAGALAASAHFDGTGTAKGLNLNIIIDDADVSDGASDVVLASGTVTVTWINLGDY